jgi:phosphatidylglycerol lysyltransferase
MIREKSRKNYSKAGMRVINIGSSAVVNISQFSTITVKNKWWRWVRNKAAKQNYSYATLLPPYNAQTMSRIEHISEQWLSHNKHAEKQFALGYYDNDYLQTCTLHVLKNTSGEIIAFANQLPTHGKVTQATIDLMRYMPNIEGVMALLLSEILLSLANNSQFKTFDLGLVPLTHVGKQPAAKALFKLSKRVLKPVFSIQGLEQFKNKFDPVWEPNYAAWEGDMLDLPLITAALQRALTLK